MDADNTVQDENSRESLFFYGDHSFPVGLTADNQWDVIGPLGTYTIENEDKMLTGTVSFNTTFADGELDEGGGAGPLHGAFGASYREDTVYQKKDNLEDELVYLNGVNTYRYPDYSGSGGIDSWKYGLSWRLNDALRLRFTRAAGSAHYHQRDLPRGSFQCLR